MLHPLILASVLAGLAYFVKGGIILKGLTVAPLVLLALLKRNVLLGCALAFGSLGDVLLDISPALFPVGLGAFLVGHVLYTILFTRSRTKPFQLGPLQIGLILFALSMSIYLVPAVGPLAPAVVAYMIALVSMAVAASMLEIPLVTLGAILFVMSDSILAVEKFRRPLPLSHLLIWWTYVFAQLGIAVGFLRSRKQI